MCFHRGRCCWYVIRMCSQYFSLCSFALVRFSHFFSATTDSHLHVSPGNLMITTILHVPLAWAWAWACTQTNHTDNGDLLKIWTRIKKLIFNLYFCSFAYHFAPCIRVVQNARVTKSEWIVFSAFKPLPLYICLPYIAVARKMCVWKMSTPAPP